MIEIEEILISQCHDDVPFGVHMLQWYVGFGVYTNSKDNISLNCLSEADCSETSPIGAMRELILKTHTNIIQNTKRNEQDTQQTFCKLRPFLEGSTKCTKCNVENTSQVAQIIFKSVGEAE